MTLSFLFFYFIATFQNFQDQITQDLFYGALFFCWVTLMVTILMVLLSFSQRRPFQRLLLLTMIVVVLSVVFVFLYFIKVWIYQ